ncbi:MAG TPA: 30S ribosomal protein S3 [Methanomicrobia archaeon]|nr:30S ribosomal protein S3 [Methanomicrobia archaeon]
MDEFFEKELERAGYGGMEMKRTPMGTQITVNVEKPGMIIGKDGRRIKQLTEDVARKQELDNPQIDVQPISVPDLNASLMANRLAKLIERGWHFRRAGRSTLQRIMDRGALGCEIIMSGKLKGPRGRMEKMIDGYIKHCGVVAEEIVDRGYAIAKSRTGVIGVRVWIVKPDAKVPDALRVVAVNKNSELKPKPVKSEAEKGEEGKKEGEEEERKKEGEEVERKKEGEEVERKKEGGEVERKKEGEEVEGKKEREGE